ncbi:element excision factor XisI family protein [Nostoc sp.]
MGFSIRRTHVELLKLGVPYQDIVLGFQPARVRSDTEFAVG